MNYNLPHTVVLLNYQFPIFCLRDGKISLQEMISALRRVQNAPSESKCQKMAEILDPDQDGTLDLRDVEKVCNTSFVRLRLRIQFS